MALESAYGRVLSSAGLPRGFYDSPSDFAQWIADDVDPAEIQERAQDAAKWVANTDPEALAAWQTYYGIGQGDLVAYALDRKRGLDLLNKQANAVILGTAAGHQGLALSRARAEHFADLGAAGNAEQGFSTIAEALPGAQRLSSIYGGEDVTQTDLEDEVLGGLASARRKRQRLVNEEEASFGGSAGAGRSAFGRSTAGSY